MERAALEALAEALARKAARHVSGWSPSLAALQPSGLASATHATTLDHITRRSILKRIRLLASSYQLQWLVDQETFATTGPEAVDDARLTQLLQDMEAARQCIVEGESLEDAGLIRDTSVKFRCNP